MGQLPKFNTENEDFCELAQILGLNSSFEYASDDRQITAAGGLLCFFFAMSLKPLFSKATTMTNCD
jgi:hypothetical protein